MKKISAVSSTAAMADMALLLLIFFMATTNIIQQKAKEVKLPHAVTDGVSEDNIYVVVKKTGEIMINDQVLSQNELENQFADQSFDPTKKVAILADEDTTYENIEKLLQLLKEYDLLDVVFIAKPEKTDDSGNTLK